MAEMIVLESVECRQLDFNPNYAVGRDGSIWSRYVPGRKGLIGEWRRKNSQRSTNGYLSVTLYDKGKETPMLVHRLVLLAFIGEPKPGEEVAHDNGIRNDNRLENLRWDTRSGNFSDKHRHGTAMIGESHPNSKLKEHQVVAIKQLQRDGKRISEISRALGLNFWSVRGVVDGKVWKHVS